MGKWRAAAGVCRRRRRIRDWLHHQGVHHHAAGGLCAAPIAQARCAAAELCAARHHGAEVSRRTARSRSSTSPRIRRACRASRRCRATVIPTPNVRVPSSSPACRALPARNSSICRIWASRCWRTRWRRRAARLGEADPTADVEGYDAAYKIAILSSIAFTSRVDVTRSITRALPRSRLRI